MHWFNLNSFLLGVDLALAVFIILYKFDTYLINKRNIEMTCDLIKTYQDMIQETQDAIARSDNEDEIEWLQGSVKFTEKRVAELSKDIREKKKVTFFSRKP